MPGVVCGEGVATQHVDVFRDQRGKALYVFIGNIGAAAAELAERGVRAAGVPQDDGVQDQAKCAELVFLAFSAGLSYLSPAAV